MTKAETIYYHDPWEKLLKLPRPASERKLRLFACACCRRLWDWLGPEGREAGDSSCLGEAVFSTNPGRFSFRFPAIVHWRWQLSLLR